MAKHVTKRLFDLTAATVGLIILLPLITACILAIRMSSPGAGLLAQVRIGRHQVPFTMYKLRTMQAGTPAQPTHISDPAAITSIGRLLRRCKLDELPQLFNVVLGDMSLVGPRPCLPSQTELITARQRTGAFSARPGVTGLAQIAGLDMSRPAELAELDGVYARSGTFWGDMKILLMTCSGRGLGIDPVERGTR